MTVPLDRRAVRFPSSGHIWIPRHGRRAAASGLSMHSPCTPLAITLQRVLWAAVRVTGSRVIPGERTSWEPPAPGEQWDDLLDAWTAETGGFDSLALYHRPQTGRVGFSALLMRAGRGVAFARVHPDAERVQREFAVMTALHGARPSSFRVARPLSLGTIDAASWMLTESLPNHPLGAVHRADARERVSRELSAILDAALDRPAATPKHWVAAHGDFTPWNLRTDRSRVIVIDWEDAGFAPPGTDLLYGALTAHTTFGSPLPLSAPAEAAEKIEDDVRARAEQLSDDSGEAALLRALQKIQRV